MLLSEPIKFQLESSWGQSRIKKDKNRQDNERVTLKDWKKKLNLFWQRQSSCLTQRNFPKEQFLVSCFAS